MNYSTMEVTIKHYCPHTSFAITGKYLHMKFLYYHEVLRSMIQDCTASKLFMECSCINPKIEEHSMIYAKMKFHCNHTRLFHYGVNEKALLPSLGTTNIRILTYEVIIIIEFLLFNLLGQYSCSKPSK